jgi:NADPH:quinone reductase-like Zn-dependent oxidoreductase
VCNPRQTAFVKRPTEFPFFSSGRTGDKSGIARELREQVWPLIEAGTVRPVIHTVFAAEQAAQAHALMESSVHVGKIVLDWTRP